MKQSLLIFLCMLVLCSFAQQPVGIFQYNKDIGYPKLAGSAHYDEKTQVYTISGAGSNIWFNRDEFHYLYQKISGDFILTADFEFIGDNTKVNGHRKIGWMVRESADESAASMNAAIHMDEHCLLQWRPYKGMWMRDPEEERFFPKRGRMQTIQLKRIGNIRTMKLAHPGEPLQLVASEKMELKPEVLFGLFICSHDSDEVAHAKVWNVRIDKPVLNPHDANPKAVDPPVRKTMGSRLEILDVSNGNRQVIYESKGRFEEPNWMPDGEKLLFNEGGSIYTILVTGGTPEKQKGGTRMFHLAIETNDAEGIRKYLASKRVKVPESASKGRTGNSNYFVTNPNGTICEIVHYEPNSFSDKSIGKDLPDKRVSTRMSHVGFMIPDLKRLPVIQLYRINIYTITNSKNI